MKPPLLLTTLSSAGRKGHIASAAAPDYRRFAAWSRERVAHLRSEWRRVSLAGVRKHPELAPKVGVRIPITGGGVPPTTVIGTTCVVTGEINAKSQVDLCRKITLEPMCIR